MRKALGLSLLLLALLSLAACKSTGGTKGDDKPVALPEVSGSVPVERLWSVKTGDGSGRSRPQLTPTLHEDLIWAADHKGRITALDAQNGRVQHRYDTGLPLSAGPVLAGELLLVGSFSGELIALDAKSGAERWRKRLSSEILSAPLVHDGVIVVRCLDGRVFGMDPADGRRLWVYDRSVPLLTLRGNSDPLARAGRVYMGFDDGQVVALRVADGSLLWTQRVSTPEGRTELDRMADIDGPMQIVGSELYAVTYHGRLASLALESGRVMWVKDMSSASGLDLRRTGLAVSDADDTVWMVDRRNSATLWSDKQLRRRKLTRPVFLGGLLLVADFEGWVHFYDADNGTLLDRVRAGKKAPATAPIVRGNVLYLFDEEGTLSAWRVGRAG